MRRRYLRWIGILLLVLLSGLTVLKLGKKVNWNTSRSVGEVVDEFNGVNVYYNGGVGHTEGRNVKDGYNLGMKYQCVEFVKRYYFEFYHHRMPDTYGNAKDFFMAEVTDGEINSQRNLRQFVQGSTSQPAEGDLIVFDGTLWNKYGHVAIISSVTTSEIEIIQQNPGPYGKSRETYALRKTNGKWRIDTDNVLGWLRMP